MAEQVYDNILEIKNLSKSYGDILAVDDVSFAVRRGSLFAFLGQNGAGKSTTIKCIITLLKQDKGEIYLDKRKEAGYIREKVGAVFQDNVLDNLLTVKENLYTRGYLYLKNKEAVKKRYEYLSERLKLKDIENQRFRTLSGGQKRRVEIARALFSNPEILLLDEPTTGLDPETRVMVWDMLLTLQKEEKITLFLTTHYMEEAAKADYVMIIHKGRIVAEGSPSQLKEKYSKDFFKVVPKRKADLTEYLDKAGKKYHKVSDEYLVEIASSEEAVGLVIGLQDNIKSFEVVKGTLDDVFISVVEENNE